jgi:ElaB/YqjD/DUF883 family membrane-anchored ribosome-binding protein
MSSTGGHLGHGGPPPSPATPSAPPSSTTTSSSAEQAIKDMTSQLSRTMHESKEQAAQRAEELKGKAMETAKDAKRQASFAWKDTREFVRRHPYVVLGILTSAVMLGMFLVSTGFTLGWMGKVNRNINITEYIHCLSVCLSVYIISLYISVAFSVCLVVLLSCWLFVLLFSALVCLTSLESVRIQSQYTSVPCSRGVGYSIKDSLRNRTKQTQHRQTD